MNRQFTERKSHMTSNMWRETQSHKKSENENKATVKIPLRTYQIVKIRKSENTKCWWGNKNSQAFLGLSLIGYFRDQSGRI